MVYYELIRRLTGMIESKLREYNIPPTSSAKDVCYPKGCIYNMYWTINPENEQIIRGRLKQNMPKALKSNQKALVDRIREFIRI